MDVENILKELRRAERYCLNDYSRMAGEAAATLSTLQAENEKLRAEADGMRSNWYKAVEEVKNLRAELDEKEKYYDQMIDALSATDSTELERVKQERDALTEDFVDYVTGGVPNPAIFCKNRCNKCVDMRGWCTGKNCKGFYPSGASGQKED